MLTLTMLASACWYTSHISSDGSGGRPIEQTFGRKHSTSEDHENSYLVWFYQVFSQFCLYCPCSHTLSMFSSSSWVAPVTKPAPAFPFLSEDRSLSTVWCPTNPGQNSPTRFLCHGLCSRSTWSVDYGLAFRTIFRKTTILRRLRTFEFRLVL